MLKIAFVFAMFATGAMAAVQPYKYEGVEIPKSGVNPDLSRKVEPCLEQQRPQRVIIMTIRDRDGNIIAIGRIPVRQRC